MCVQPHAGVCACVRVSHLTSSRQFVNSFGKVFEACVCMCVGTGVFMALNALPGASVSMRRVCVRVKCV